MNEDSRYENEGLQLERMSQRWEVLDVNKRAPNNPQHFSDNTARMMLLLSVCKGVFASRSDHQIHAVCKLCHPLAFPPAPPVVLQCQRQQRMAQEKGDATRAKQNRELVF